MTPLARIDPEAWRALPPDIRDHLIRADFRGRLKANMAPKLRGKVLERLNDGSPLDLRVVAGDEAARLWREGVIAPAEYEEAHEYITGQIGGYVASRRDDAGNRLYLCTAIRTYTARDFAPEETWIAHGRSLLARCDKAKGAARNWMALHHDRFGRLPDVAA